MQVVLGVESLLSPPLTGVGHYARHVLLGLRDRDDIHLRCMANGRLVPPPFGGAAAPQNKPTPRAWGWLKRGAAALPALRRAADARRSRIARRELGAALYHEPNHILRLSHRPSVVTVMDLSVLRYPHFHPADRVHYFERHFVPALNRANLIITPSAFTRDELVGALHIDPATIRVVPLGVDESFRPMPEADVIAALRPYDLPVGDYVLALGTREPRKNLERLLDAYLDLPPDLRARHRLVLVGPAGWRAEALERRIASLARDGTLLSLGYVPDHVRSALYNGAAVFAYPSLYEGFGLPPLEALACGTQVLTSQNSPMAEILGAAADLIDPLNVPMMTSGLARLLTDPDLRRRAITSGPALAEHLRWSACIAGTVEVYREVLALQ